MAEGLLHTPNFLILLFLDASSGLFSVPTGIALRHCIKKAQPRAGLSFLFDGSQYAST